MISGRPSSTRMDVASLPSEQRTGSRSDSLMLHRVLAEPATRSNRRSLRLASFR